MSDQRDPPTIDMTEWRTEEFPKPRDPETIVDSHGLIDPTGEQQRKAELTRQRLANLARGREEAAARAAAGIAPPPKTRGRPANRPQTAPMPREATPSTDPEIEEYERQIRAIETGEVVLTRESNTGTQKTFDVPEQGKRPNWDYQWKTISIFAQPVDRSDLVEVQQAGWIEVHPSDFPSLMPFGYRGRTIERQGQRLYMRPLKLSQEAQLEAFQQAFEQKDARLRAAAAGDTGREFAPRDPRAGSITIEPLM